MFNTNEYKAILNQYLDQIDSIFDISLKVSKMTDDKEMSHDIFIGAALNMCIKYETMTSDLNSIVFKNKPMYNHPWSNTRLIANILKIDIEKEYETAHDAWDIYNNLKHVNHKTRLNQNKILKKYNLNSAESIAKFIRNSLKKLIIKMSNI